MRARLLAGLRLTDLRLAGLAGALLGLAACASTPAATGTGAADMARALAGGWDTRVQAQASPGATRVVARFTPIVAPALAGGGGQALYVEWRAGGPDGALLRQQVWTLQPATPATAAPRLELWTLADPAAARGADAGAPLWARLGPADLRPASPRADGPDCALAVTPRGDGAFDAASDPMRCRAVDPAGRAYGVAVRITLMPTGLLYQETGVYDDDTFAFKSPPETPYDFRRP